MHLTKLNRRDLRRSLRKLSVKERLLSGRRARYDAVGRFDNAPQKQLFRRTHIVWELRIVLSLGHAKSYTAS